MSYRTVVAPTPLLATFLAGLFGLKFELLEADTAQARIAELSGRKGVTLTNLGQFDVDLGLPEAERLDPPVIRYLWVGVGLPRGGKARPQRLYDKWVWYVVFSMDSTGPMPPQ